MLWEPYCHIVALLLMKYHFGFLAIISVQCCYNAWLSMKNHLEFLAILSFFSVQCFWYYNVTVLLDHQWDITLDFLLSFQFNSLGTMMSQCCLSINETSPWISFYYFSSMPWELWCTVMLYHQWEITLDFLLLFQFNALGTMMSQCCLTISETSPWISCYHFSSILWELWCHSVALPSMKHH